METVEQQKHSLSRLEHFDFIIKNLERQQNFPIKEAYCKGSLLDRIVALETKLFQICLEMESSSGSSTSVGGSCETSSSSSSLRLKRDLTKTLPVFSSTSNTFHVTLHHPQHLREMNDRIEEEDEEEEEEDINIEKPLLEKKKKKDTNENCKPKKKKKSPKKWSRFSLLGC